MDKSWVRHHRTLDSYTSGMNNFLDFAFLRTTVSGFIKCPCRKCLNRLWEKRPIIIEHLTIYGMDPKYMEAPWIEHGETYEEAAKAKHDGRGGIRQLLEENFRGYDAGFNGSSETDTSFQSTTRTGRTPEAEKFFKLVQDTDLYPGCKSYKKLDFILELYRIKVTYGWSDTSFTEVLELIKKALPAGETLPNTFYHTKKLIGELREYSNARNGVFKEEVRGHAIPRRSRTSDISEMNIVCRQQVERELREEFEARERELKTIITKHEEDKKAFEASMNEKVNLMVNEALQARSVDFANSFQRRYGYGPMEDPLLNTGSFVDTLTEYGNYGSQA